MDDNTEKKILRYLHLVDRRLYIIMHSGIEWRPEYGPEMDQIDKELLQLRDELGMDKIKKPSRRQANEDLSN